MSFNLRNVTRLSLSLLNYVFITMLIHSLFLTRLEAVNPNVAFPGMPPTCTIGWKTLKEDDDADHFTFLGDDRTLDIEDQSK